MLSSVEKRILTVLKSDGRASVTTLSSKLGVARATVKSKLDKLISSGIIRRFTIEVDASAEIETIKAVMLIELEGTLARTVTRSLRRLPEVVSLHTTNGSWDLVGQIEVSSLAEFDRILREVREIEGVLNSQTNLLLNLAQD